MNEGLPVVRAVKLENRKRERETSHRKRKRGEHTEERTEGRQRKREDEGFRSFLSLMDVFSARATTVIPGDMQERATQLF